PPAVGWPAAPGCGPDHLPNRHRAILAPFTPHRGLNPLLQIGYHQRAGGFLPPPASGSEVKRQLVRPFVFWPFFLAVFVTCSQAIGRDLDRTDGCDGLLGDPEGGFLGVPIGSNDLPPNFAGLNTRSESSVAEWC